MSAFKTIITNWFTPKTKPEKETDSFALFSILHGELLSTKELYAEFGENDGLQVISAVMYLLKKVTDHHGGAVVKTQDNTILCTFIHPDETFRAARAMHRCLDKLMEAERFGNVPLQLRIGIHVGKVVWKDNDLFGDAVTIAFRIMEMAEARQITTTEKTLSMLSKEYRADTTPLESISLKGKPGSVKVVALNWQTGVTDKMDEELLENVLKAMENRMTVRYGNQVVEVDQDRPEITLGRHAHNDIVVEDNRISRTHIKIIYKNNKFYISDQSTNGTYLKIRNQKGTKIHRVEARLTGSGVIGLARRVTPESSDAVHFEIMP